MLYSGVKVYILMKGAKNSVPKKRTRRQDNEGDHIPNN